MGSPKAQGLVDPCIKLVDHDRWFAGVVRKRCTQNFADIGNRSQVSGLYVLPDKAVKLIALRLRQVHTLQAADLINYKIVAQLSSLQGLLIVRSFLLCRLFGRLGNAMGNAARILTFMSLYVCTREEVSDQRLMANSAFRGKRAW